MLLWLAFLKTPSLLHFVTIFFDGIYNTLGAFSVARLCDLWAVKWDQLYAHLWSNLVWLEHVQSTCGRMRQVYGKSKAAKINSDLLLIFLSTLASFFTRMLAPLPEDSPVNYTAIQ